MNIRTFKAIGIGGKPVPDLSIVADEEINESRGNNEKNWASQLDEEATAIVDALVASLPGGVLSRIHAILTQRYANLLRIAWEGMESPTKQEKP